MAEGSASAVRSVARTEADEAPAAAAAEGAEAPAAASEPVSEASAGDRPLRQSPATTLASRLRQAFDWLVGGCRDVNEEVESLMASTRDVELTQDAIVDVTALPPLVDAAAARRWLALGAVVALLTAGAIVACVATFTWATAGAGATAGLAAGTTTTTTTTITTATTTMTITTTTLTSTSTTSVTTTRTMTTTSSTGTATITTTTLRGARLRLGGRCAAAPLGGDRPLLRPCPEQAISDAQAWRFEEDGQRLESRHGLCAAALGDDVVCMLPCDVGDGAQHWEVDDARGSLLSKSVKRCIAAPDQVQVGLRDCEGVGDDARRWRLARGGEGELQLAASGGCLTIHSAGANTIPTLRVEACDSVAFSSWSYEPESGHVLVGASAGERCLEAPADGSTPSVLLRPCSEEPRQKWTSYASGQMATGDGMCLVAETPGADDGGLAVEPCDSAAEGQRWDLALAAAERRPGNAPTPTVTVTTTSTTGRPAVVSAAPLLDFYTYRAVADHDDGYRFGDMNVANMDGVIWYLMNEVVTMYTSGTRCPRKFGISKIKRFRMKVRATQELFNQHMNFGVRFAYDRGLCSGRCFPSNQCTCQRDCDAQFGRYGYVVGCNNFRDNYPFPGSGTPAPDGIWYSLPLGGRCEWPTGAHDCTWSFEEAGEITLHDLQMLRPGGGNCCDGQCTSFWDDQFNVGRTYERIHQALDLFAQRFPGFPRDLPTRCDFNRWAWYQNDPFGRQSGASCPEFASRYR